jgi:Rv2632c-like
MAQTTTVQVSLEEDEEHTEAHASLRLRERDFVARGQARRNPHDPNVPVVGEELAVARALSELSHQLLAAAAETIEGFVGHHVTLTE